MLPDYIELTDQIVTDNLDDLLDQGDNSGRPFSVLVGANMGHRTLILSVPLATFYEISDVANRSNLDAVPAHRELPIAQRRLDEGHARRLAVFILKGLIDTGRRKLESAGRPVSPALLEIQKALGTQPYISLQPIVANIRNCKPGGKGLRFVGNNGAVTVYLSDRHVFVDH